MLDRESSTSSVIGVHALVSDRGLSNEFSGDVVLMRMDKLHSEL